MDTETYEKSRQPTALPAKDLADFAKRLHYIADEFSRIGKRVESDLPKKEIQVTGRPTAERGEKFLRTWLKTLRAAMDDAVMGQLDAMNETKRKPPKKE